MGLSLFTAIGTVGHRGVHVDEKLVFLLFDNYAEFERC